MRDFPILNARLIVLAAAGASLAACADERTSLDESAAHPWLARDESAIDAGRAASAGTVVDGGAPDAPSPLDAGSAASSRVLITDVSALGSICPRMIGSVVANGSDIEVRAEDAPSRPETSPPFLTGGCTVSINVTPPHGYRYTVESFDARALVSLAPETEARLESSFWFGGDDPEAQSATKTIVVGLSGEHSFPADFLPDATALYSTCGNPTLLHLRLQAYSVRRAIVATNRVSVTRVTALRLRFEPCSSDSGGPLR